MLLVSSFVFFGNKSVIGAPAYHEKSILDNQPSKIKLSKVESLVKPRLIKEEGIELGAKSFVIIDRDTLPPIL